MAKAPSYAIGNTTPSIHDTDDGKEGPQNTDNDIRNAKIFPFWLHYANVRIPKKQQGSNTPSNSKDVAMPPD